MQPDYVCCGLDTDFGFAEVSMTFGCARYSHAGRFGSGRPKHRMRQRVAPALADKPTAAGYTRWLETSNLSAARLAGFCNLHGLQQLDLHACLALASLPDDFGCLSSLRRLRKSDRPSAVHSSRQLGQPRPPPEAVVDAPPGPDMPTGKLREIVQP